MRQGFTLVQLSILLAVASLALAYTLPASQRNLKLGRDTTAKLNSA